MRVRDEGRERDRDDPRALRKASAECGRVGSAQGSRVRDGEVSPLRREHRESRRGEAGTEDVVLRGESRGRAGEVLVAELFNVEQTTLGTDVGISQILDSVDNGSADRSSDTVVVGFSDSSDSGDVGLEQVVLGEIYD